MGLIFLESCEGYPENDGAFINEKWDYNNAFSIYNNPNDPMYCSRRQGPCFGQFSRSRWHHMSKGFENYDMSQVTVGFAIRWLDNSDDGGLQFTPYYQVNNTYYMYVIMYSTSIRIVVNNTSDNTTVYDVSPFSGNWTTHQWYYFEFQIDFITGVFKARCDEQLIGEHIIPSEHLHHTQVPYVNFYRNDDRRFVMHDIYIRNDLIFMGDTIVTHAKPEKVIENIGWIQELKPNEITLWFDPENPNYNQIASFNNPIESSDYITFNGTNNILYNLSGSVDSNDFQIRFRCTDHLSGEQHILQNILHDDQSFKILINSTGDLEVKTYKDLNSVLFKFDEYNDNVWYILRIFSDKVILINENTGNKLIRYWTINTPKKSFSYFLGSTPPEDVLMLRFDTGDGGDVIDDSPYNHESYTHDSYPESYIVTSFSKFGGSCLRSWNGRRVFPDSQYLNFGRNDFTIEFWLNPDNGSRGGYNTYIMGKYYTTNDVSTAEWRISYVCEWPSRLQFYDGSSWHNSVERATRYEWNHVVICRKDAHIFMGVNGVVSGPSECRKDYASTHPFVIGFYNLGDYVFRRSYCYLDNIRITNGIARLFDENDNLFITNSNISNGYTVPTEDLPLTHAVATNGFIGDIDSSISYWEYNTLEKLHDGNISFSDITNRKLSNVNLGDKLIHQYGPDFSKYIGNVLGIQAQASFKSTVGITSGIRPLFNIDGSEYEGNTHLPPQYVKYMFQAFDVDPSTLQPWERTLIQQLKMGWKIVDDYR